MLDFESCLGMPSLVKDYLCFLIKSELLDFVLLVYFVFLTLIYQELILVNGIW